MDELFGYENFKNEIIHVYGEREKVQKMYNRKHQTILFYVKDTKNNYTFNSELIREVFSDSTTEKYKYVDENGRKFRIRGKNQQAAGNLRAKTDLRLEDECEYTYRDYYDVRSGPAPRDWFKLPFLNQADSERTGYDTQKNPLILERIIKASSNEGDLVLDCFCGSGTTAAVAEKLNRRWITCDLGRFAIHTTRKRLLGIDSVKPFIVQNLGKYERQQWMNAEFENPEDRLIQERTYKHFIIDLYHAKPLDGYTWLHGAKAGRLVHVGNVDAPITVDDIKATILEFWKLTGKEKAAQVNGVDFLGWDFAFDVNETAKQFAAENKVNVSFKKIPREVLEKKAVEQGDIKFYELASLAVKTKCEKKKAAIILDNFIIPPDDVPEEVQGKITHWSQWIDYWAVDWNYKDDTFHNMWQSYRTKKNTKIELTASNAYEQKGKYTVLVKVIDILGNDTTKAIQITV